VFDCLVVCLKMRKVIGYMAQGSTVYPPGTDLHELKTYVTSRILWDSSRDPLTEIAEFIVLYCAQPSAHALPFMRECVRLQTNDGRVMSSQTVKTPAGQQLSCTWRP
jgi:hypothetical protein